MLYCSGISDFREKKWNNLSILDLKKLIREKFITCRVLEIMVLICRDCDTLVIFVRNKISSQLDHEK